MDVLRTYAAEKLHIYINYITDGGENGSFDPATATLTVVQGAKRGDATTLAHEIGEYGRAYNYDAYKQYVDTVINMLMEMNALSTTNDILAYHRTYHSDNKNTTIQDAKEELVNDVTARLFFAEGGIEQVVEYVAQNKEISVKEKKTFLETLKEIVNKIVDIVKNYVTNNHLKASEKAVGDMSLDDIKKLRTQFLDVIDGAISNLENGVEVGTSTKNSTEVTFKNKISINNNFERDYDKWDKNNPRTVFTIGKTSDALKSIGIKNADIIIDASKLIKIRNDHPEMTDEIIKQIPNIIENPIIVMESKSVNSRVTMFGEVISGKTPILVVLELSPKKKNKIALDKIKVASAYGKNNAQNFINSSNILYVDSNKKRVKAWEKRTGLQLPVGSSIPNSNSIISNPNENVNIKKSLDVDSEGNTLSKQQQEYFKESKVRDENGNFNRPISKDFGSNVKFSHDVPVEETKDLIAVHNISEEKLMKSLQLGGLPMPSIAVMKAKEAKGNSVYGNISLVFPKSQLTHL